MKKLLLSYSLFLISILGLPKDLFSQSVGIGTVSPNASAQLDVSSNNKGVLIPRLTKAQRNAITSPAKGLMIFIDDTDSVGFHFYDGGKWNWVQSNDVTDTIFWKRKGNAGTNPSLNFIGTTDNTILNFRVNNNAAGRIDHINKNTFFGYRAGLSNTTGFKNIFMGDSAGRANTAGNTNIYIGVNAGAAMANGVGNVFIGDSAGASKVTTGGTSSVFIGDKAGSKTTMEPNTFIGNYAGRLNTTGSENCFVGSAAGTSNTTGIANTFLGEYSGYSNLNGETNLFAGTSSGYFNTSGSSNVFLGMTTGSSNTSGNYNVFIGSYSGNSNITGNKNVTLGYGASPFGANLSNTVAIGFNARVDTSNGFVLGSVNGINGATATSLVGIGTTLPVARLHVEGGNILFTGPYPSLTSGNPPQSGAGTRMMWYYDKAAFRAGLVNGTQWDKINTGDYSFAAGVDTKASAHTSVAMGYSNSANGQASIAMGEFSVANGTAAATMGHLNQANGLVAMALGSAVTANGDYSMATGNSSVTTGNYSFSAGLSTRARAYASMSIGRYNDSIAGSSTTSWVDTDPLFIIGNGTSTSARKNAITVLKNARTGINTSSPLAMLHVADSSVLFTASPTLVFPGGAPPVSGVGNRMMWYASHAALRAGGVSADEWDEFNVGYYSIATGFGNKAYGYAASSFGAFNISGGNYSLTAGQNNTTTADNNIAMGYQNTVSGTFGAAIGYFNNVSTSNSMALGTQNQVTGNTAFAFGSANQSSGVVSLALGNYTKAVGDRSTTMGFQTMAKPYASVVIGQYNDTTASSTTSWDTDDAVFIVGNGTAHTNRSNAMTVLKNGNVGIGAVVSPQYGLHVVNNNTGDGGWVNGIMIENISPDPSIGEAAISFKNAGITAGKQWSIGINQGNPQLSFFYGTGFFTGSATKMCIDTLGNVGIGITTPAALLDVDGTTKLGTNGTALTEVIKVTVNKDLPSIAVNNSYLETFAVSNAQLNSTVYISPATALADGLIICYAMVSGAGNVQVKFRNVSAGAIDPAAMNFFITVIR